MIYLDNNASTPVDPEVVDTICTALRTDFGNPSSPHPIGLRARASVEKAREQVAGLIGSLAEEIFFTSGGTESNNLAIIGMAQRAGRGHIITSVIEHPSVINTCRQLEGRGFDVTYVNADSSGRVIIEDIKRAIKKETILITVMHANNETGVIQPVEEIGLIAREKGITFHTDAAQSIGKIPVNVSSLNVDMMSIASHKFYGPKGIGALYIRKGLDIAPILYGAGHEKGLRPGTENVPGIAGIGKASELSCNYIKDRVAHTKRLTDLLYRGLRERIEGLRLNGHETMRLPNTLNICIPGVDAAYLLERIKNKVAASSGSACHAGRRDPSPVLKAMGLSDADALSSIRLSTGKDNTEGEIREAVEIIAMAALGQGR